MALALLAMLSCKKEMVEPQTKMSLPELSTGNLLDYEYYTPTGDVETEIRAALLALENDDNLGYTSINRGVWLLETGISYLMPDTNYYYTDFDADTNTYILTLNDLEEISEADLKNVLIALHTAISEITSAEVSHVATDIKVIEIGNGTITLGAFTTLLSGVNKTLGYDCNIVATPPFSDINWNQQAFLQQYCAGSTGPGGSFTFASAATTCARQARPALRCLTAAQNRFYTQIATYSSVGWGSGNNQYIDPENLLGHTNSPVLTHQSWVPVNECVFSNQLNIYSQIIYNDITNKMGKDKNLLSLAMTYSQASLPDPNNPNSNIWHCKFEYLSVQLGSAKSFQYSNGLSLGFL